MKSEVSRRPEDTFLGRLKFWSIHCAFNVIPGVIIALVLIEMRKSVPLNIATIGVLRRVRTRYYSALR